MNKKDLIEALKNEAGIGKKEASAEVSLLFYKMAESLANGDRVEIRGLCSFYVKEYKGCTGRNPTTGDGVEIKPKKLPFFKASKGLKEMVGGHR